MGFQNMVVLRVEGHWGSLISTGSILEEECKRGVSDWGRQINHWETVRGAENGFWDNVK